MKVAIAIDSFKDGASNQEINKYLFENLNFDGELLLFKMSDGGENALQTLCEKFISIESYDALQRRIQVQVGILDGEDHAYVVEMAKCVGLEMLKQDERNAMKTSTYGFGVVVKQLITEYNANHIILTVGGSATNDLGFGFIQALGAQFINEQGQQIDNVIIPDLFPDIAKVDISLLSQCQVRFQVLADVTNQLTGLNGCSYVYGPQKGLTQQQIVFCDSQMSRLSKLFGFAEQPSDGAAGGIVYTLRNTLGAKVQSGANFILEHQGFSEKTKNFDLLVTGEGKFDFQTGNGKAVAIAAKLFKGTYKVGVFGQISPDAENCGLDELLDINEDCCNVSLTEKLNLTKENIFKTVEKVINRKNNKW